VSDIATPPPSGAVGGTPVTRGHGEGGFTLIELLIVIVILGIIAAVVVFSVGGVTDTGAVAACKTDTATVSTAEEAYYATPTAGNGKYGDFTALTAAATKFLQSTPTLHTVTLGANNASYTVKVATTQCGVVGDTVGTTDANGTINY